MHCDKPTLIRFRVFEYDMPSSIGYGGGLKDSNSCEKSHDTGKEFTVSHDEVKAYMKIKGYNDYTADLFRRAIAPIMLLKLFGFSGSYANNWFLNWTIAGEEGYIGSNSNRLWYIKRIV